MSNYGFMGISGKQYSAAGDLLGGVGEGLSGFAQASAYGNNAEIDKMQAGMAVGMTRVNTQRSVDQSMQILGAQKAAIGSSGIATAGSAADVLRQTATQASLDKALVGFKGGIEALDWQLKYKSDKKSSLFANIGGVLDVIKGVATAAAVLA